MLGDDWMEWATGWFADMRACHASRPIVYVIPGVMEVPLEHATIVTNDRSSDDMGIGITSEEVSWILDPTKIQATLDQRFPSPGDIIRAEFNGQYIEFEVCAQSESAPCWEWVDSHRKMIRVFCKSHQWPEFVGRP